MFSADFIVAILVLLFLITSFQVYQSNVIKEIQHEQRAIYRNSLVSRTDTMVLYPGQWKGTEAEVLGFAVQREDQASPNRINETKVEGFLTMDESKCKELLGLRGRNFYFFIKDRQGSIISDYEKGDTNWHDADNVYRVKRNVFLQPSGESAVLELIVW